MPNVTFSTTGFQPCNPCTYCAFGVVSNCASSRDTVCITSPPSAAPIASAAGVASKGIFPNMTDSESIAVIIGGIFLLLLVLGVLLVIKFCCLDDTMYSHAHPTAKLRPQASEPIITRSPSFPTASSEPDVSISEIGIQMTNISALQPPDPVQPDPVQQEAIGSSSPASSFVFDQDVTQSTPEQPPFQPFTPEIPVDSAFYEKNSVENNADPQGLLKFLCINSFYSV